MEPKPEYQRQRCDWIERREVLRLGGLSAVGLGLPELLAAEKTIPSRRRPARSCVLIFMEGGPSHIDLWDLKPQAPAEVRGEFQPIPTTVPGLRICDQLPLLARQMHRLAQVRSITHGITDHNAGSYYALTGRHPVDGSKLIVADSPKNFPPFGAVLAKLCPAGGPLPDFIHLPEVMSNNGFDIPGQSAGFLGPRYDPLVTGDPSLPGFDIPGLRLPREVQAGRLQERMSLLEQVDRRLGQVSSDPQMERMGEFYRKAFEVISSPAVRRAFDLGLEPASVRERYGSDPGTDRAIEARKFGGLPHLGQCMLLTRRLVEAGVRLVTVCTGRRIDQAWDTHRDHFPLLRQSLCPMFDRSVSVFIEDLAQRGLLDETLIVLLGEFGRTPKLGQITSGAGATRNGRDHWPYCYTALFAGAGIPGGAVHGASDRHGAYPSRDPVTPEDIAATIYALMGVPLDSEIRDPQDKPYALIQGSPVRPLLG